MLKAAILDMVQELEQGSPFSASLAKYPNMFSAFYQRMTAVGEETGHLEPMMRRAADYMERDAAIVSKGRRALVYPSIVMVVGIAAGFVLVIWTVPALTRLFAEFEAELPLTTRILMAVGDIAGRFGLHIALATMSSAVLGGWYIRTKGGARRRDYLLMRVPVVSGIIQTSNMARFTSTLNTLLKAGLPMPHILDMLTTAATHAPLKEALGPVKEDLLAGERLGQALRKHDVFPRLLVQMVSTGEESGSLETNLEAAASFYEEATARMITGITTLLEPMLVLFIGLAIGFVAVSVISPMYSIVQQIK